MAKTLVILLCIVVTVGPVKSSIARFSADRQILRPGETIVFTCEISNFDVHDLTHINKIHPDNSATALSDNYDLVESLQGQRNRFNFSYKDPPAGGGGVLTQTLSILNSVPGDSGNYSCSQIDVDMNRTVFKTYLSIIVQVEPQTIKFYLNDTEVYNGSTSTPLQFLQQQRLRCETTRSNPGSNITITTGNGKHVHLTNITVGNATYEYNERDQANPFVIPIYRNTTALANNWFLDADAIGKPVVCTAKVDQNAPGITTSFLPVVAEGKPQIQCNDTVYAQNGQRDFVIECLSFAKPSISNAMFYYVDKKNYTIQGFPVNVKRPSDDGKVRGIVQPDGEMKASLRLTIDTVDLNAKIVYNFLVENSYGQTIHDVMIADMKVTTGTASSMCINAFLFICLIALHGITGQL